MRLTCRIMSKIKSMKIIVNTCRFLVGLLFIFSGIVKANDPHGLSYKMQEFFDVWSRSASLTSLMNSLSTFALPFSLIMITLEIMVGIALILGIWRNLVSLILLILMVFFTFLTGYAALSGKIATCGCFGDCLPLTSMQSFIKDLVLLFLVIIIVTERRYIRPLFSPPLNALMVFISLLLVMFFQWYVMRHLPVVDCLPFKAGNNILQLRKMPANAIPDVKEYQFTYQKDGKTSEFSIKNLPDSSWEFVSRKDIIIEKGKNNEPPIKDFYLNTLAGADTTQAVLSLDADFYLFFVNNFKGQQDNWLDNFTKIYQFSKIKNRPLYIVSSQPELADQFFNKRNNYGLLVFALDATAFKTAARTDPELYLMHGPVVQEKWGWADLKKAPK